MSYVTDYTGELPANLITEELLTSYNLNNTNHYVLTPANAPFYIKGLVVKRTASAVTTTLVEGQDYWPALLFIGATRATGIACYGAIYVKDTIATGVFKVTYQVVGTDWVLDPLDVQTNLTALSVDPRTVSWETTMGNPAHFDTNIPDWEEYNSTGLSEIVDKLSAIDAAIILKNSTASTPPTLNFTTDATGTGTTNITLNLRPTGVTPSIYTKFTVDAKGRITDGAEVRSLADLGIATDYITQEGLDFTLANEVVQLSHIGTGGAVHANATTTVDGFMSPADKIKINKASIFSLSDTAATALAATALAGTSANMSRYDHVHPTLSVADTSNAGLMSAADKVKLNGVATGAQANDVTSVATRTGSITLVKSDFGLGNLNNTSDANKPVSTAFQTELNGKQGIIFDYLTTDAAILAMDATALTGKVAKATDTLKEYVSDGLNWVEVLNTGGSASVSTDDARQPIPLSPVNNAVSQNGDLTLSANAFAPMYDSDTRIHRQFQVTLATDTAFAAVVYDSTANADSIQVDPNLDPNTAFIWRCRDKFNSVTNAGAVTTKYTAWSSSWKFTTANVVIATTTRTSITGEPDDLPEEPTITMSAFSVTTGTDTHVSTTWKIYDATNALIYTNANDTTNLTSWTVPAGVLTQNSDVTFKVVYNGDHFSSSAASKTVNTMTQFAYKNFLSFSNGGGTYISIYGKDADTFTKLANPASLPTGNGYPNQFSSDGTYLAVGHGTTPFITIYKRSGDTFTKLANPASLPGSDVYGCSFSPDNTHLAVAHNLGTRVTIYKRSGDVFTKLAFPYAGGNNPSGAAEDCAFSPD